MITNAAIGTPRATPATCVTESRRDGRTARATGWSTPTLCLENVLDHHGQARPIDFDDASWGHYAQDLAIAADNIPEELHPVLLGGGAGAAPGCRDLARAAARSAPQSRNQGSQR